MRIKWNEDAAAIGRLIQESAQRHSELGPLLTAWKNFARKHGIGTLPDSDQDALVLVHHNELAHLKDLNHHMTVEIEALDNRVKTLLER